MFSPGIDSTSTLVRLLKETRHQILVHHVRILTDEGRHQLEAEQTRKIIAKCRELYRDFHFSGSGIDHRNLPIPGPGHNLIAVGFEAGIIANASKAGRGKMIDGWTIGTCREEGLDEARMQLAKSCCAANCHPHPAAPFFLLPMVTKREAAELIPRELRDLCSNCRRPVKENGQFIACGDCQTCLHLMGVEEPVLLLHNPSLHPSAIRLYDEVAERLVAMGLRAKTCHGAATYDFASFDTLISRHIVAPETKRWKRTLAGNPLPRPEEMVLLADNNLPVMQWSLAATKEEVAELFKRWDCERILLKKSHTFGGEGVSVFTRDHPLEELSWDSEIDIFCAEVNPDDGDIYKAELFNGEIIITWRSMASPLREIANSPYLNKIKGAYGERELIDFPPDLTAKLEVLSRDLTARGISYVSVDFMKDPTGTLRAIEINLSMIATWWTVQFEGMKDRFATAIAHWLSDE